MTTPKRARRAAALVAAAGTRRRRRGRRRKADRTHAGTNLSGSQVSSGSGGNEDLRSLGRHAALCGQSVARQRQQQEHERAAAEDHWTNYGLVFTSKMGTALDSSNLRHDFRNAIENADGIDASEWTPRELSHSFVSLLSDSGMPLNEISQLIGHNSTVVTELVYRKQLRPVIQSGAVAMDRIFSQQ